MQAFSHILYNSLSHPSCFRCFTFQDFFFFFNHEHQLWNKVPTNKPSEFLEYWIFSLFHFLILLFFSAKSSRSSNLHLRHAYRTTASNELNAFSWIFRACSVGCFPSLNPSQRKTSRKYGLEESERKLANNCNRENRDNAWSVCVICAHDLDFILILNHRARLVSWSQRTVV